MATLCCRPAAMAAARSIASLSKTLVPKMVSSRKAISPLTVRSIALSSFGSVDSLMPLHSAIATSRLRSFIAVDSSSLSWLSQGVTKPS